jgi:hypothetical protein
MGFDYAWAFRDCPWCGLRDAQMTVRVADADFGTSDGRKIRYWSFLSCPRCAGFIALETSAPNHAPEIRSQFPEHGSEINVESLPPDVEAYYRGAIRVMQAGVPDAAAVQLRRTLEAAAAHHGVDSGALVQRIKRLIAEGKITNEFGDVLHHIREVGNVGAHAGESAVDDETAERALRFTTQVLRNLFEIPAQLKAIGPESGRDDETEEPQTT